MSHFDEDDCERYALNQLTGEALAKHEEHLLICERCQWLQTRVDEYVVHMKRALGKARRSFGFMLLKC